MEEDTKFNITLVGIILMSIILGGLITIAYDSNRINYYVEESYLTYEKAINICKVNYNVNAELKELDNRFEFSVIEVKDE